MSRLDVQKSRARLLAKSRRAQVSNPQEAALSLIHHAPISILRAGVIGGVWPLPGEIDTRPLITALSDMGEPISLPCTPRKGHPLTFRAWRSGQSLVAGPYGTREPANTEPVCEPTVVLVPLLAFTATGDRLGYGGGFYDRTLSAFRQRHAVFACGVAYAAQEADHLPIGPYDVPLDGLLTDRYFKRFS